MAFSPATFVCRLYNSLLLSVEYGVSFLFAAIVARS